MLIQVTDAARHCGHLPSHAEMRLYGLQHLGLPNDKTIKNHFPTKAALATAIRRSAATDHSLAHVLPMLPAEALGAIGDWGRAYRRSGSGRFVGSGADLHHNPQWLRQFADVHDDLLLGAE